MKYIILSFFMCFGMYSSTCGQELSYGISAGASYYDLEIDKPYSAGGGSTKLNIGGFIDIPLTNGFGIGGQLLYATKTVEDYILSTNFSTDAFKVDFSSLTFQPSLKWDVDGTYEKGFYLLAGPSVSFNLGEGVIRDLDVFESVDEFTETTRLSANIGFGVRVLKHFNFEIVGDLGISDRSSLDTIKSSAIGIFGTLQINLASLMQ